jgi:hypothetical protein
VVLNFEARGTSGPPVMFETSAGNAALAGVFADAAPHPVASSFAVEVYRALPNDTDFSVLLDAGFAGLNTAFIDGAAGYHTPQDTPDRLDRATLQAMGDNALALARDLGDRELTTLAEPGGNDATYFPVPGGLIRYSGDLVKPLAGAAVVAVALLVWALRRRGESSLGRTAVGTGLALLPLAAGPLAVVGFWSLLVAVRPGYGSMLDPWRPGWYRLAAVAVVAAVVLTWYALLRRRIGGAALAAGALIWLAVLAVVLAFVAPGGAYLATWPALAGAVGGVVAVLGRGPAGRVAGALIAGAVAVAILAPTVALFFPALGLRGGYAPAFVATLLAVALLPAFELLFPDPDARRSRLGALLVPGGALVVAAACALVGLRVDTFDTEHPVPSQLVYALDTELGQAWWASTEDDPGEYTARYVDERQTLPADFPYLAGEEVATGDAEIAELAPPLVTVLGDRPAGDRREITVRVTPQRPGVRLAVLDLRIDGGTVSAARVEGRTVADEALGEDRLWVTFHAPPAEGVQATFVVSGEGALTLRAIDGSDGLDGLPGFHPRPDGVDAAGTHSSDLVVVAATTPLG